MKEDAGKKFYDETKTLYMEPAGSGARLGVALLQTKSNTSDHKAEAVDNSILQPIVFASKSLTEVEKDTAT